MLLTSRRFPAFSTCFQTRSFLPVLVLGTLLWLCSMQAFAAVSAEEKAQIVVHMLDYISVDYPEFVQDGKVLNEDEFAEQLEFSSQSIALLKELPKLAEQDALLEQGAALKAAIERKADGAEVSEKANGLRTDVIRVYQVAVAPKMAPNLAKAAKLYAANCVACHGAEGRGDGPLADGMEPTPSDFHDEGRMSARSIFGLYNTITLGVASTPMQPFAELAEEDRWALAFFASGFRADDQLVQQGQRAWEQGTGIKTLGSLRELVTRTPLEVRQEGGESMAAVQTYLTRHPEAIQARAPSPLQTARDVLQQSLEAYRAGDQSAARQLAITAYLEGFELIENSLANVDGDLMQKIERAMMDLRAAIGQSQPIDKVAEQIEKIDSLLDDAEAVLSGGGLSPATAFLSALLILLREGLEAILVLAAVTSFVVKTDRRDALRYIHYGWVGAVALGIVTWIVSNYLLTISGANREMTEGITALIAAVMLLYVGYWLHSKSYAQAWQKFIREHVTAALGKRTMWAMAGVSFLAVYRELFEVILFYQALWVQAGPAGHTAVLAGIGVAAILLALIGWGIFKYSIRLPIGPFFGFTSALLALLAVVFAGNGIAALQEAGVVEATRVAFISAPLLGIHPTVQGLSVQVTVLFLVFSGMWLSRRQALAV